MEIKMRTEVTRKIGKACEMYPWCGWNIWSDVNGSSLGNLGKIRRRQWNRPYQWSAGRVSLPEPDLTQLVESTSKMLMCFFPVFYSTPNEAQVESIGALKMKSGPNFGIFNIKGKGREATNNYSLYFFITTLWSFNIAMNKYPFVDDLPIFYMAIFCNVMATWICFPDSKRLIAYTFSIYHILCFIHVSFFFLSDLKLSSQTWHLEFWCNPCFFECHFGYSVYAIYNP